MSFYQCSSLKHPEIELRLVLLHPGKRYDSVHCDVVTVTPDLLQEYQVSYEALSYCWGKDVASNTIFIDGLSHQVTPNLEHALRHLRKRTATRILWIDALCINQQNIEERNKQVPRMGWIYKNAKEVVVWIGKDDEKEDHQIEWNQDIWPAMKRERGTIQTTKLAFQLMENLAWFSRQTTADQPDLSILLKLVEMCKNADYCANICRLFRREWFERVWTIQEVVLAQKATVVCGYQSISWAALDGASKGIINPEITTLLQKDCPFFTMMGQHRVARIADCMYKRDIFPLLDATQASKFPTMAIHATDSRDKLFGLLGIMSPEDAQDIVVDYNMQAVDIYRSWVEKRVSRTGSLDALSVCANTRRRGFPSWVPDLNHRFPQDLTLFAATHSVIPGPGERPPSTVYQACGPEPANPQFATEISNGKLKHKMIIRGLKLDIIEFIAPSITSDIVPPTGDIQDILEQLENMLILSEAGLRRILNMSKSLGYSESKTKLLYEFGTTLFRGYSHPNITFSMSDMYECYRGRKSIPELLTTVWPPTKTQVFFANFGLYIRNFLWYARFFVTSGGDFGVVSENCNMKEEDDIWILRGGKTPFVMRQVEGDWRRDVKSDEWEILGPCFVYGVMNGERVDNSWAIKKEVGSTDVMRWAKRLGTVTDVTIV